MDPEPGLRLANAGRHVNKDFREHFGFLALVVVCGACTVYLMGVLRVILRPFLLALFLVMGLTPLVSVVERMLLCMTSVVYRCLSGLLHWVCTCSHCICTTLARSVRGKRRKGPERQKLEHGPAPSSAVIGSSLEDRQAANSQGASTEGAMAAAAADSADARRAPQWSRCARFLAHSIAITIVVAFVMCVVAGFVFMVIKSVLNLREHWSVYKMGVKNITESIKHTASRVRGTMPQEIIDQISSNVLLRAEHMLSTLITDVLSHAWSFVFEFLMMALYIAFWLSDPMPVGNKMEELFKRYILLKALACSGYGICVGVLLHMLSVDLPAAFGLAAFLLSFVPEVGAIVAVILPAPVILFDSRLESPVMTLIIATSSQLGLKFVFANVVEVKLVEADQLMKLHPVIVLLAVAFFGYIWGPTGMLLSVPLVAYVKVALLSDKVPARYRDPVLVILEGDKNAPARYARRRGNKNPKPGRGECSDTGADSGFRDRPGWDEVGGLRAAAGVSELEAAPQPRAIGNTGTCATAVE